jgi:hypothetical protein
MISMSRSAVDLKRARWDLNPGSPAPQASVLIQTRPRALSSGLRCFDAVNGKIVTTLIKLKNTGLARAFSSRYAYLL